MKIALLTNLYPPLSRGGAEKVAERIVGELKRRGHDVFVVSTKPYDGWSSFRLSRELMSATRVYRLRPINLYHPLFDHRHVFPVRALWHVIDLFCPCNTQQICRLLEEEKPDIILTHNLKGLSLRLPKMIRSLVIPWIHTIHDVQLSIPSGLLFYGQHNWLNRSFLQKGYQYCVRHIFGSPNVVIFPSAYVKDFYEKRGFFSQSHKQVIPNPAPPFEPRPRGKRQTGPSRLFFAGQLEKHKGILFLLRGLARTDMPFHLHIAGEGTLVDQVNKICEQDKRFSYHGFLSLEDIQDWFAVSDAAIVPSLCYENSPTIIYESLQSGVPVIASNIWGVGELIQEGRNGYLFEPGNRKDLLRSLKELDECKETFWSSSVQIRTTVEPYALNYYLDSLEEMMQSLSKPLPDS